MYDRNQLNIYLLCLGSKDAQQTSKQDFREFGLILSLLASLCPFCPVRTFRAVENSPAAERNILSVHVKGPFPKILPNSGLLNDSSL